MAAIAEALRALGIDATEQTLVEAIVDVLAAFPPAERRAQPSEELTPADAQALRRGGMDLAARDYGARDPFLRTRAKYSLLVASGLPVSQVARNLGTTEARVRQRLKERTLYGVKTGGEWRLPTFQFLDDGKLVPELERVLPAVDPQLNLVALYNWFTQPDADLRLAGREVSPREWLETGEDPARIVQQATSL